MTLDMNQTIILQNRIEELEEELRQIKEDICPPNNPFVGRLRFTPLEAALLWTLYNADGISTIARLNIIVTKYGTKESKDGFDPTNSLRVRITYIRTKLKRYGVKIQSVWGVGYIIRPESKKKLQKIMEKWQ